MEGMRLIKGAAFALIAQPAVAVILLVSACSSARSVHGVPPGGAAWPPPRWGTAKQAPGTASFYDGGRDWGIQITSMSCAVPGNCSAGGYYQDILRRLTQPFLISKANGVWGRAQPVPGLAALSTRKNAEIVSVSCASPGNCSAGGYVRDNAGHDQALVVSQINGTWAAAAKVPSAAALGTGGTAHVSTVSCASPGNCAAAGLYAQYAGVWEAFIVSQ